MKCFYCFKRFEPESLMLRCGNTMCRNVDDPVHQEFLGSTIRYMNKIIFNQQKGLKYKGSCPECSKPATTLVCPHCHNEIPKEMINANITVVSLIGVSGVGKTHYVTMLLKKSLNNLARFGVATRRLGEQTFRRMDENYDKYLASETPLAIPRTVTAMANTQVKYPWIFVLDRRIKSFLFDTLVSNYLVIYDAAGEDFLSADLIGTNVASIAESDGWIFLLDPLQFPKLRHKIPECYKPDSMSDQKAAIERAYGFVREKTNTSLVEKPIAITMTKIDVLETCLNDVQHSVFENRPYKNPTDLEGIERDDGIIRGLISDNMEDEFSNWVDAYFKNGMFFGISALGSSPEGGRLVNGLKPLRLEDPILWLFATLKKWKF
ncbi:MAG: hypothetical protein RBS43_04325 [Candidatus Cloacimonas sp.]|nr:hypothetical protein [Candidatus Cloacimonas sp.]